MNPIKLEHFFNLSSARMMDQLFKRVERHAEGFVGKNTFDKLFERVLRIQDPMMDRVSEGVDG